MASLACSCFLHIKSLIPSVNRKKQSWKLGWPRKIWLLHSRASERVRSLQFGLPSLGCSSSISSCCAIIRQAHTVHGAIKSRRRLLRLCMLRLGSAKAILRYLTDNSLRSRYRSNQSTIAQRLLRNDSATLLISHLSTLPPFVTASNQSLVKSHTKAQNRTVATARTHALHRSEHFPPFTLAFSLDGSTRPSQSASFKSVKAQDCSENSRLHRPHKFGSTFSRAHLPFPTFIMPSADRNKALPGGGPAPLITLKTHSPLPAFSIPHRVPDPSTEISSFKLSILRILTGQTNAQSSTKPLTFSEEVKEKAINGWKMQMLTLELRQRDDLEAEEQNGEAEEEDSNEMRGFELQDHHECSLIEEGDQIIVRLKPNHTLAELELPKLPSGHRYSAPSGSLTRAGTLSEPPPYSIIQPSEPSSFSSSVGAQPNANYHQHRYQDYRSAFRVVTATNVGSGHVRRSSANNAITGYAGNPTALVKVSICFSHLADQAEERTSADRQQLLLLPWRPPPSQAQVPG